MKLSDDKHAPRKRFAGQRRQLSRRERALVSLASGLILAYVLVLAVILPIRHWWQRTDADLLLARIEYLHALKTIRQTPWPGASELTVEAEDSEQASIVEFLREIETAAGPQVNIHRFQPLRSHGRPQYASRAQAGAIRIFSLGIQIDCQGRLPAILTFIDRIERTDRFTRIKQFTLTPAAAGNDRLQCQLTVERYSTM